VDGGGSDDDTTCTLPGVRDLCCTSAILAPTGVLWRTAEPGRSQPPQQRRRVLAEIDKREREWRHSRRSSRASQRAAVRPAAASCWAHGVMRHTLTQKRCDAATRHESVSFPLKPEKKSHRQTRDGCLSAGSSLPLVASTMLPWYRTYAYIHGIAIPHTADKTCFEQCDFLVWGRVVLTMKQSNQIV
jgi:hypothetical protein